MKRTILIAILLLLLFASCSKHDKKDCTKDINVHARNFVKLALSFGKYDADYVDAYFGPDSLKKQTEIDVLSLEQVNIKVDSLIDCLKSISDDKNFESSNMRLKHLLSMAVALKTRIEFVNGKKLTFDDESRKIYGVTAPHYSKDNFEKFLKMLDYKLPGEGSLENRFNEFKKKFIIPVNKLDAVFKTSIAECRRRTKTFINLPENENFKIEYVKGKSWGAYNWYKGNSQSLIQVNTDLPAYIDAPLELAAHEGYPGHHVFHSLNEKIYSKEKNWVEYLIYPLFSPESLISEGSASYGINVIFSKAEKVEYVKHVLFPIAGIDTTDADKYFEILDLISELKFSGIEAARDYLDGKITKDEAINWLVKYDLRTKERAEKNLKFFEQYRSYIINYALGEELIKIYIQNNGGTQDNPSRIKDIFKTLLTKPMLPADLK